MASASRYSAGMSFEKIRRIAALLAALVLAAGLVAHGSGGPDIVVKSAMTAASDVPMPGDMPMPGKCNGCAGEEKGIAPAACFAFCGAVIALPLVAVVLDAVPAETLKPTAVPGATGHGDPRDPYPARSTILTCDASPSGAVAPMRVRPECRTAPAISQPRVTKRMECSLYSTGWFCDPR